MPVAGSTLDRFDHLDLLVLDGRQPRERGDDEAGWLSSYRWQFPILDRRRCVARAADIAVALWNALPDDAITDEAERPRCYHPGYALQFVVGSEIVLSAGLCFSSDIAYLDGPAAVDRERWLPAASTRTQALLRLCRDVGGGRATETLWPERFLDAWIKGHG